MSAGSERELPEPLLLAQIAIDALTAVGFHVLREGEVPPWMERVVETHERPATPEEVDDGCELGWAYDLSNFVGPIEMLVQHLASQSRTPPHYFFTRGPPSTACATS